MDARALFLQKTFNRLTGVAIDERLVYTSQAGFLHIQLLQIEEFEDGPVKPVLIVDSTEVHTGTCTHLQ